MKQKLQNIFFLFLLGTIGANAQGPVITAAGFNPVVGDNYKVLNALVSSVNPPDYGGTDKVWDYSNLKDSSVNQAIRFISTVGIPFADSVKANIAYVDSTDAGGGYTLFNTGTTSWNFLGGANANGKSGTRVSPSQLILPYPMTFGMKYSDSIVYYDSKNIPDHIEKDTLFEDAYGTLKLPGAIYKNVVRVFYENTSSSYPDNMPYGHFKIYKFYVNGIHYPILQLYPNGLGLNNEPIWEAIYYKGSDTIVKPEGPVITAEGASPRVGDNYSVRTAFRNVLPPSAKGPNQTWDYSNIIYDTIPEFRNAVTMMSPNGLKMADSFPNANVAIKLNIDTSSITFNRISDSSWEELGTTAQYVFNGIDKYKKPIVRMVYPISYNQLHFDSNLSGNTFTFTYDTLCADAYGTLKMPNATYTNVLRVSYTRNTLNKQYWFLANGMHYPILILGDIGGGQWGIQYAFPTPLPLQISSFTASWQNKMPYLQWSATNTENTKAFNVQRSADGNTFSNVGQVAANASTAYHFADYVTPTSAVYYRLQQVDKTGKFFYSNTLKLSSNNYQFSIYPNPAKGSVHLSVPSGNKVVIMVYNIAGKLVYENKNFIASDAISTSSWSKGTYTVRIKDNNGWQVNNFEKE